MMMTAAFAAAGAATSALASSADSADTALNFCNRHDEKIFIAVAFDEPGDASAPPGGSAVAPKVFARGWWGIDAGACTKLTFPLVDDRILLFAQSASQTFNWIGDSSVCVDLTHAFEISDAANQACNGPNQGYRAFKVVNVPSLPAPAPDSVATYEFKTQDAVRVGGGLKFCNDTQDPVYLSFGQKRSRDTKFSVDGWFSIKPDNCYETTRDSSADEVWYYAQGGSGTLTWRGDTPLCTDDVKGYTFEDAANMPCTGTNQMMELFQRGVLAAAGQDFEHHFKVADAHKIRSQVDICNNRQEKIYVATADQFVNFKISATARRYMTQWTCRPLPART
jgi:uncharacterized membrane protein